MRCCLLTAELFPNRGSFWKLEASRKGPHPHPVSKIWKGRYTPLRPNRFLNLVHSETRIYIFDVNRTSFCVGMRLPADVTPFPTHLIWLHNMPKGETWYGLSGGGCPANVALSCMREKHRNEEMNWPSFWKQLATVSLYGNVHQE